MKRILLPLCAAAIGYAAGFLQRPEPSASPQSAPISAQESAATATDEHAAQAVSAFISTGDFRQLARIGPLLEKMSDAQIGALLDRLTSLRSGDGEALIPMILAHWTRQSPDAAFAWMEPRLARFARQKYFMMGFANADTDLAGAWADNDPVRAIEYARNHHATGLADKLLHDAIHRLRGKSEAEKFALLREFPEGAARDKAIRSFCSTWAYSEPAAVIAAGETLSPGAGRDGAIAEGLVKLAGKDRQAAFEKMRSLGFRDPKLELAMVAQFAKDDPAATAAWMDGTGTEFSPAALAEVTAYWAKKAPAAALTWALAHGIPLSTRPSEIPLEGSRSIYQGYWFQHGGTAPLFAALEGAPEATREWVKSLPPGEDPDRTIFLLCAKSQTPENLKQLIPELPPEAALALAAAIVQSSDDAKASEWAQSLSGELRAAAFRAIGARSADFATIPPGPDRDAMLDGYAYNAARTVPAKALDAVMQITDPALRRRTFDDVMWALTRGDIPFSGGGYSHGPKPAIRAEAREWLEKSSIPSDWRSSCSRLGF